MDAPYLDLRVFWVELALRWQYYCWYVGAALLLKPLALVAQRQPVPTAIGIGVLLALVGLLFATIPLAMIVPAILIELLHVSFAVMVATFVVSQVVLSTLLDALLLKVVRRQVLSRSLLLSLTAVNACCCTIAIVRIFFAHRNLFI